MFKNFLQSIGIQPKKDYTQKLFRRFRATEFIMRWNEYVILEKYKHKLPKSSMNQKTPANILGSSRLEINTMAR